MIDGMRFRRPSRRERSPVRRQWIRRPLTLAIAGCVGAAAVGLSWSLASPIGASPDDDFHLASIWCDAGDAALCRRTGQELDDGIEKVLVTPRIVEMGCYAFVADASAGCQREGEGEEGLVPSRANDGLYPGGFYRLMSVFASSDIARSVVTMRMVSWVLAIALLVLAAATAGADLRRAFSLAALTTLVPMGVFLFASNNPSGLAVAGVAAYWCAAHAYMGTGIALRPRSLVRIAVLVGGSLAALGARADAGAYLGGASLAVWISTGGYRTGLRRRSLLLAGVSVVGVWTTLTAHETHGRLEGVEEHEGRGLVASFFDSALELPRLLLGSLGTSPLGWLDTPMPGAVSTLMLLAFGGVLIAGLTAVSAEKWTALAVLVAAAAAIPMTALVAGRFYVGDAHYVQPRYLLPIIPVIAGTALAAPRGRPGIALNRGQLVVIIGAVAVAHGAALHTNIRRYVTGLDVKTPNLNQGVEWWWASGPSPLVTWLLGSIGFVVAAACGFVIAGAFSEGGSDERGLDPSPVDVTTRASEGSEQAVASHTAMPPALESSRRSTAR